MGPWCLPSPWAVVSDAACGKSRSGGDRRGSCGSSCFLVTGTPGGYPQIKYTALARCFLRQALVSAVLVFPVIRTASAVSRVGENRAGSGGSRCPEGAPGSVGVRVGDGGEREFRTVPDRQPEWRADRRRRSGREVNSGVVRCRRTYRYSLWALLLAAGGGRRPLSGTCQ